MPNVRVGTSGWSYEHWRGPFYPKDLPQPKWLDFYCTQFDTVELNNPFYRLPKKETFEKWRRTAPEKFVYAVKASRYITHVKKLLDVGQPVQTMLDNYAGLGEKLGPILFQFPPSWSQNLERLASLLELLPSDGSYAFEFRHKSWLDTSTYRLLSKRNAALCIPDSPTYPRAIRVTASFAFVRMHGGSVLYGSDYSEEELARWARRIERFIKRDLDVYVYFNNDAHGYAVANARRLKSMLGLGPAT